MAELQRGSASSARSFAAVYAHEHEHEEGHWWFQSRLDRIQDVVRAHLPRRNGLLLDLGCGSGRVARALEGFGRVVGSDLSAAPLAADGAAGRRRLASSAFRLPFRDGVFDVVTALDVVEHLEDDGAALREMFRILRPDGVLILTVPAVPLLYGPHDRVLGHWRRYSSADLRRRVLASGGGRVRSLGYFISLPFPVLLAWRLVAKVFGPFGSRSDGGRPLPEAINRTMSSVMNLERSLSSSIPPPFGSSLICVTTPASATAGSAAGRRPS